MPERRVRGVPTEQVEINRLAHRKLDPLLIATDIRLQKWGTWARPYYLARGFPVGPGVNQATCSASPRPEWPAPIVATDDAVQCLPRRLAAATMAHYLNPALPLARRALVFVGLVQHLAQLRREKPPALGAGAFRDDLDRARWTLNFALRT